MGKKGADSWARMCTLCGGNRESHDADQKRLEECPWKDDMANHPDSPGKGKARLADAEMRGLSACPWQGLKGHPTPHPFRSHGSSD